MSSAGSEAAEHAADAEPLPVADDIDADGMREVGDDAVWSLSTAKPGNGVVQLRDNNLHTFWQSDGTQPHWVSIQFAERTSVCLLCVYLDHRVDESYTPRRVTLHAGSKPADLQQVGGFTLSEPCGWVTVALSSDGIEASQEAARAKPLRCFLLRIVIHTMHQSGRDTHVRQLKVYSPCSPAGARVSVPGKPQQVQFTSEQFHMFSCVR